jgi:hypothetical protein
MQVKDLKIKRKNVGNVLWHTKIVQILRWQVPKVFKIRMGKLRRHHLSNGSNIGLPYINMNTMAPMEGVQIQR